MALPADGHVHSEWSWDTADGSMEQTCTRAARTGIPAVAFTDHVDFHPFRVAGHELEGFDHLEAFLTPDGHLTPPAFDLDGYLECVERCRSRFPDLRILSGVEFGQPHRRPVEAATAGSRVDRLLGSLHSLQVGDDDLEPPGLFRLWSPDEVMRRYLAEVARMIESSDAFDVLTHITYPVRYWPKDADPFRSTDFADELRHALSLLAGSGRALEINTRDRLDEHLLLWWREVGGAAVSFGSDAHAPDEVGRGLAEAAEFAAGLGFVPGADPGDFWTPVG